MKMTVDRPLRVLRVDSSGQLHASSTRALLDYLLAAIEDRFGHPDLQNRELTEGIPHVDEDWINSNLTPAEDRSAAQRATLAFSDLLIDEVQNSDVIAIGVPAALKAWVDMIARAHLTFRYSEQGPIGLLQGRMAILVVSSGGVAVDSNSDFATPYMRQALRFLGITDIVVVAADQQVKRGADAVSTARAAIDEIIQNAEFFNADTPVAVSGRGGSR